MVLLSYNYKYKVLHIHVQHYYQYIELIIMLWMHQCIANAMRYILVMIHVWLWINAIFTCVFTFQKGSSYFEFACGFGHCMSAKLMKEMEPYFRFGNTCSMKVAWINMCMMFLVFFACITSFQMTQRFPAFKLSLQTLWNSCCSLLFWDKLGVVWRECCLRSMQN